MSGWLIDPSEALDRWVEEPGGCRIFRKGRYILHVEHFEEGEYAVDYG